MLKKSFYQTEKMVVLNFTQVYCKSATEVLNSECFKMVFGSFVDHLVKHNKVDLVDKRQVTTEQGKELADKLNAKFYEVSAKENHDSINKMIEEIAEDASKDLSPDPGPQNPIKNTQDKDKKNSCC